MNAKKQTLQKILTALIPYWDLAEGFLFLLQEEGNNELIDSLYAQIIHEIKNIKNKKDRINIQNTLEQIKAQEKKESKQEQEYLEALINNI